MKPITNFKSFLARALLISALLITIALLASPLIFRNTSHHSLYEAVSNGRQIKLILDTFAMDNEGVYPNADSAALHDCPIPTNSNEAFLQLFTSGNTNSEKIFHINKASICNSARPDDVTTTNGLFDPSQTLQSGDNAFSYFMGLENVDHPDHPLLVAPFGKDLKAIDSELFEDKAIIVFIDGSARAFPLNEHGLPTNSMGFDLLHQYPQSKNPTTLLHPIPTTETQ